MITNKLDLHYDYRFQYLLKNDIIDNIANYNINDIITIFLCASKLEYRESILLNPLMKILRPYIFDMYNNKNGEITNNLTSSQLIDIILAFGNLSIKSNHFIKTIMKLIIKQPIDINNLHKYVELALHIKDCDVHDVAFLRFLRDDIAIKYQHLLTINQLYDIGSGLTEMNFPTTKLVEIIFIKKQNKNNKKKKKKKKKVI